MSDNRTIKIDLPKSDGPSLASSSSEEKNGSSQQKSQAPRSPQRQTVETVIFGQNEEVSPSLELEDIATNYNLVDENYEKLDPLAVGGQGEILKAKDRYLNRRVALKRLLKKYNTSTAMRRDFVSEAKLTAQLDHPGIIPIYSVNSDPEASLYFSMKLINGITFREYLDKIISEYKTRGIDQFDEHSSLAIRLDYFLRVCDAVSYAHSKGVVHRDLKPENIMIGEFREVYVMDWGIADVLSEIDPNDPKRRTLDLKGTPGFIDPENVNERLPSPFSDIYALGIILYEIVTLREGVIKGETIQATIFNSVKGIVPEIQHLFKNVKIDQDLRAIIEKARYPKRKNRYQSVNELAQDIRRYQLNQEVSCRPDHSFRRMRRWIQRNIQFFVSIVLAVILLLASAVIISLIQQNISIRGAKTREIGLTKYQSAVAAQTHRIDRQFLHLEHLMHNFSNEAMDTLNSPNSYKGPLYSNADYASEAKRPKEMVDSSAYGKLICFDWPVYKLAPGVSLAKVEPVIKSIFGLRHDFHQTVLQSSLNYKNTPLVKLEQETMNHGVPIKWLYIGLANGVFVSYPGKGGYPPAYDPRERPWYREALKKTGLSWGSPYYDVQGQGIVMPCTFTLRKQTGQPPIGVVACDITLDFLVQELMNGNSSLNDHTYEKTILDNQGRVLISSKQIADNTHSNKLIDSALTLSPYSNQTVIDYILKQKSGQIILRENNRDMVYAFGLIPTLDWFYLERIPLNILLSSQTTGK